MSIPVGATHTNCGHYYRKLGPTWQLFGSNHEWITTACDWSWLEQHAHPIDDRKSWSGPEDGLPPVGTVCEVKGCMSHYLKWNKVTVFAVRWKTVMFDMEDGRWGQTESHEFRAIQTKEQLRETAIRELMDIAKVDCRVTAARLVDAGFKREVV